MLETFTDTKEFFRSLHKKFRLRDVVGPSGRHDTGRFVITLKPSDLGLDEMEITFVMNVLFVEPDVFVHDDRFPHKVLDILRKVEGYPIVLENGGNAHTTDLLHVRNTI